MKELIQIIEAYRETEEKKLKAALATVTRVRGSSYRRSGSRMLITENAHWVGSVSGGCLEGDALTQSLEVIKSGIPKVVKYDTRHTTPDAIGMGYGCNGILEVLIHPIDTEKDNPIDRLSKLVSNNEVSGMATVFQVEGASEIAIGQHLTISADEEIKSNLNDENFIAAVRKDLDIVMRDGINDARTYKWPDAKISVLLESFQPQPRLLIFGAVFHAVHLKHLAEEIGWQVLIADDLSGNPTPPDFPGFEELELIDDDTLASTLANPNRLSVLFLTHNFMYIGDMLQKVLPVKVPYIGILGSRKKTEKILRDLNEKGVQLTEDDWKRLHYPVGLDIGGSEPGSIALAILAEMHAKLHQRTGGFLKERKDLIHDRPSKEILEM